MSANLDLPQILPNQNQKEQTSNDADAQLDGALTDTLPCDMTSGDVTVVDFDFQSHMVFECMNQSVSRALNLPAIKRAIFFVKNSGTGNANVTVGSTAITVVPSATTMFATDGTANGLIAISPTGAASAEVDICVSVSGKPLTSQNIPIVFNQTVKFPVSLTGSNFSIGTNPTATLTFTFAKNGTGIGSVAFSTGGVPTATFASAETFAPGDILVITAPGTQDATGADISLNFKGSK